MSHERPPCAKERNERSLVTHRLEGDYSTSITVLQTVINGHNKGANRAMEAQGKEPLTLALEDARSANISGGTIFTEAHELRRSHGKRGSPRPSGGRAGSPGPPSGPRGLNPRLLVPAGSSALRGRVNGGSQGQKRAPTAPYLGSGQSGPARSGEFADSGQSTRTGSGGRWRRTEAQWERLTVTGNCHSACAERPRGQPAHAQGSGVRLVPRRVRRGKMPRLRLCVGPSEAESQTG